ncbi:nicotinic acid mononucleotide adenyltransferase [Aequorivita soesokkakensis]|jgi:CTP:phosphocholine cytidylyltransferase-like protein|uniref:Nicotinic acid mononucleotide adenyltransferase n=1 Tax=Aequorivita soesokkakensis TaxID=1385699 RepID=A0A1A9LDM7_9FLAO|nr:nicotinic acid mononucleotide adenyltransferase [Aequorivita soesokkakensis]OAD91177.1 nicotinic acid mononucleotide adenyltransferase [Aequorivita soesokkakensis]
MKNILALLAIVLITSVALAQDTKKNTYFLDGDVIEATIYHDNGMVAQTGYYTKENKLTGEWVSYDTNGNKTAVAEYNDGEKVGTWYFFTDKNIKEVSYMDARVAKVVTWKSSDTQLVVN